MLEKIGLQIRDKLKDKQLRELLRSSGASLLFKVSGIILNFVLITLISRKIGPESLGIFSLCTTVLMLFVLVSKLGLDMALLKYISKYQANDERENLKGIYFQSMVVVVLTSLAMTSFLYICSDWIADVIFQKEHLGGYFKFVAFAILPLSLTNMNAEALRGLKKVSAYSFFQNVSRYLFALCIFIPILFYLKNLESTIISYVLGIFIGALLSSYLWIRSSRIASVKANYEITVKNMLADSFPMMISVSMLLVISWVDILMLGAFRTEKEVGIYNVVMLIATTANVTLFAINSITGQKLAQSFGNNDMKLFSRTIHQSSKLIFISALPIILVLVAFPKPILKIFGDEFMIGATALLIIIGGKLISSMSGSVGLILNMSNQQGAFRNIILISAVINVVLNYLLIPKYGINGAAFASMLSIVFWNISSVVFIKRKFGILTLYVPFRHIY